VSTSMIEGLSRLGEIPGGPLLLKATAWLGAAWLANALLAKAHPRARILLWRVTAVGLAALPILAVIGPSLEIPVTGPAPAPAVAGAPRAISLPPLEDRAVRFEPAASAAGPARAPSTGDGAGPEAISRGHPGPLASLALIGWISGAVFSLLRLALGLARTRRLVGGAEPAPEEVLGACRHACRALGVGVPVRVLLSPSVPGPVLAGLFRPAIILPTRWAEGADRSDLPAILAHEVHHIATGDLWWNLAIRAIAAVLWFHPLAWPMTGAHGAACEEEGDAAAARLIGAGAYRRTLARVALKMFRAPALTAAVPMVRGTEIARRLRAIEGPSRSSSPGGGLAVVLIAIGVLVLITFAALSFVRRGPAGLYEKAPMARGLSIGVGPNRFRLDGVARWDRNGSVRLEDGKGDALAGPGPKLPDHGRAVPWLDSACVLIGSREPFDVLEVRVFDHATRQLLGMNDGTQSGFQFSGSRVDIRRTGAPLPDSVDVWLRVVHAPAADPSIRLAAQAGASAPLAAGSISLRELRKGCWSYSMKSAAGSPAVTIEWNQVQEEDSMCTAVIDWRPEPGGKWNKEEYQFCAIAKDGRRSFLNSAPHYLGFHPPETTEVLEFDLSLEELAGIEFRPFRGRDVFCFDDVRLPGVGESFTPPPAVTVKIDGKETDVVPQDLDPVRLRVRALPGARVRGTVGKFHRGMVEFVPGPAPDIASCTTLIYEITGLSSGSLDLDLFDREGRPLPAGERERSLMASAGLYALGYITVKVPLQRIDAVRLALPSPAAAR
jgi:beta-lactamase regulating signal transducer with metallopeptidase domain